MKPLTSLVVIGIFAALPFPAAYFYNNAYPLETPDVAWATALLNRKEQLVENLPSPKIVLIGGSSVHFGFQAERLQQDVGELAFNFGSHAYLGPAYQLHRAKQILHSGDTAILFVEYPILQVALPGGGAMLEIFLKRNHEDFPLPPTAHGLLATALTPTLPKALLVQAVSAFETEPQTAAPPQLATPYSVPAITQWGDGSGGRTEDAPQSVRESVKNSKPFDCNVPPSPLPFEAVREFAHWSKLNGIRFFASWSPVFDQKAQGCGNLFKQIRNAYEATGVQMLGEPADFFIAYDEIFDTSFHATLIGRLRLTDTLAERLKGLLSR